MDINLIKFLAKQHDEGRRDPESVLANACLEAYEQGFDDGAKDAEQRIMQTQMLLMFTAGSA